MFKKVNSIIHEYGTLVQWVLIKLKDLFLPKPLMHHPNMFQLARNLNTKSLFDHPQSSNNNKVAYNKEIE